jgi:hypothetical protein
MNYRIRGMTDYGLSRKPKRGANSGSIFILFIANIKAPLQAGQALIVGF